MQVNLKKKMFKAEKELKTFSLIFHIGHMTVTHDILPVKSR